MLLMQHCYIQVRIVKFHIDNNYINSVTLAQAKQIADEFDSNAIGSSYYGIHDLDNKLFGTESDVNHDGKVTILLLNIGTGVLGYFDPYDLYAYDGTFYTNQQDMIYINCVSGYSVNSVNFYATIAHEFQHLINYNQKVFVQGNQSGGSQTWLTEGLSTAAEYEYIFNKDGTYVGSKLTETNGYIDYFKQLNNYNFLSWQGEFWNYAADFIFFQWLRVQSGSDGVYYAIINNNSYVDTNAVVQTVSNAPYLINGYGGTWNNWGDLLRSWFVANAYLDSSSIYGYKSDYLETNVAIKKLSGGNTYSLVPVKVFMRTFQVLHHCPHLVI